VVLLDGGPDVVVEHAVTATTANGVNQRRRTPVDTTSWSVPSGTFERRKTMYFLSSLDFRKKEAGLCAHR
jgi:hypothetical protein